VSITGGCSCGTLTYVVTAPLRNARSCHCSKCRKIFSGASSAYAEVEPGSFSWKSGVEDLSRFDTGKGYGVLFCRRCGSTLAGVAGTEVHGVTLGCIDGDPGVEIEMHVFVDSRARWDHIGGDAPQYPTWPERQ
jgi:hypothetical protein